MKFKEAFLLFPWWAEWSIWSVKSVICQNQEGKETSAHSAVNNTNTVSLFPTDLLSAIPLNYARLNTKLICGCYTEAAKAVWEMLQHLYKADMAYNRPTCLAPVLAPVSDLTLSWAITKLWST